MLLAENHVTVEDRLALFLDLPPPALLSMLYFVEHVGARARTGKHIMGIGEGLLVLLTKECNVITLFLLYTICL